ncbi:MAG TPA: hypothetical protein VKR29_13455, partial [Candidatus Binataceae bacterium]|nr:hypothetical protein [Candidatus Binataceae bacterium]
RVRAVASSHDLSAQRLYIQAGMVPRFPLYGIEGAAQGLSKLPTPRTSATELIRTTEASKTWIGKLGELDETIWGRRRDREHRLWSELGLHCLALTEGRGRLLAYAYHSSAATPAPWSGLPFRIGPVAARNSRHQLVLLHAIGDAMNDHAGATVEFRVPGINMTVLSALLSAGFKIDHIGHFMASRSFGHFDRYLPSGGTLL